MKMSCLLRGDSDRKNEIDDGHDDCDGGVGNDDDDDDDDEDDAGLKTATSAVANETNVVALATKTSVAIAKL